jgi:hypothetical protein
MGEKELWEKTIDQYPIWTIPPQQVETFWKGRLKQYPDLNQECGERFVPSRNFWEWNEQRNIRGLI